VLAAALPLVYVKLPLGCFLSPGFCYPFLFEAELSVSVAA